MQYVGIYSQQVNNNTKSLLLLIFFPCIILLLTYLFFIIIEGIEVYGTAYDMDWYNINSGFIAVLPWEVGIVGIWFVIAYMFNTAMIKHATGAHEVTRKENPRIYNIVENLTMTCGMPMPKINIMDTPELNAFASGIDNNSYTVTVTTGICDKLNDEELEGVIAHELTHIRNKDTRLLIISIIFVGIMSTVMSVVLRVLWRVAVTGGSGRSSSKKGKDNGVAVLAVLVIAAVLAALGYLFTLLTRFAISRKREFMADAGGAELCGNPLALASALRKISGLPAAAPEGREDIAQLYIIHPQALDGKSSGLFSNIFSTHPDTEERIRILEQF